MKPETGEEEGRLRPKALALFLPRWARGARSSSMNVWCQRMTQKPTYVLGINAYDHDVSACLVRDGTIAYAISKERLTREKHLRPRLLDAGDDLEPELRDLALAAKAV